MNPKMRNASIVLAASILMVSLVCNKETPARSLHFDFGKGDTSPFWNEPSSVLRPWFNTAKARIEKVLVVNTIKFDDELSVAFLLDENGGVEDPIVTNNVTKDSAQAEAVVDLLKKCVPFDKPPDELLHKQRILLLFRHYPNFFLQICKWTPLQDIKCGRIEI
jgi:hypothetical protein